MAHEGKVVEVKKAFPRNREGGGNQQGATPYTRNPKPEPLHTKPETTFTRNPTLEVRNPETIQYANPDSCIFNAKP